MANKIKILYTIPNFDTAGSGKVVYDLIRGLDSSKFEIEIACQHTRGAFFKEVKALGLPIHTLETTVPYRPYFSLYHRLKPIKQFLKKNKYQIVHSWHWSSDWTEVLACRLAGVQWLYTKKAMSWGNKHWKIRSYLANFIITINNEMQGFFPNKQQQALIPLGIDTKYYHRKEIERQKSTNFTIVTVANLVPVKGIEILLQAMALLNDTSIHLNVVGDASTAYGQFLKTTCATLKLNEQVSFIGKVGDVRPYITNADVYVIPTLDQGRKEGMPMALVEAMAMAIPTIGSDISGINYVLKDFPELLFPAGNEQKLAAILKTLKDNTMEERSILGASLRAYCLENFTMEKFIEAHEDLYMKILEN